MVSTMASCTDTMIERWAELIAQGHNEIDVHTEFRNLTADIIAHTGFGSSYAEGKRVFELQRKQQVIIQKALLQVYIPGMG
jgi:PHYB activation tagged suppressor 1